MWGKKTAGEGITARLTLVESSRDKSIPRDGHLSIGSLGFGFTHPRQTSSNGRKSNVLDVNFNVVMLSFFVKLPCCILMLHVTSGI